MFECGQPLHAFDLDKLKPNTIIVRRAKAGETITLIDGNTRNLTPDILVIADKARAVAIAGIMGGLDTEVTEKTKRVLLEAAVFNPVVTRRARQMLGIQTESAYRFERSVDTGASDAASARATALLQQLAGGRCVCAATKAVPKTKRAGLTLGADQVFRVLGVKVSVPQIKSSLSSLGFVIKRTSKNSLTVSAPSFRQDVRAPIDLIEEVARIYGFENIPTTLPAIKPQVAAQALRDRVAFLKQVLVGLGLQEVITHSLIDKNLLRGLEYFGGEPIEIANSLNKEQGFLRSTLLPGLLACTGHNLKQQQEYVAVFEVAKGFYQAGGAVKEELRLGVALCGARNLLFPQGRIKDEVGFLHLKGMLEVLCARLGVAGVSFITGPSSGTYAVQVHDESIGVMARAADDVLGSFDIKNKEVFVAELKLENLFAFIAPGKRCAPLPKYPGILRDISLVIKQEILAVDILETVRRASGEFLREVRITDYYKGKQIPAGFKGITLSCLYRSDERTLTEAEINPVQGGIVTLLQDRFQAKMR